MVTLELLLELTVLFLESFVVAPWRTLEEVLPVVRTERFCLSLSIELRLSERKEELLTLLPAVLVRLLTLLLEADVRP